MIHPIHGSPEAVRTLLEGAHLDFRGEGGIVVRRSRNVVTIVGVGRDGDSRGGRGPDVIVRVANATGNAGSATAACTLRYDIHAIDGGPITTDNRLAEALLPARRRTATGKYTAAGPDTLARAIYRNDAWELIEAYDEVPFVEPCPP